MSVINTMLKDLEQRGAGGSGSNDNILGGLSASRSASNEDDSSGNVYLTSFFGLVVILVIAAAVYYLSPYQLVSVAQDTPVVTVKPATPSVTAETQVSPTRQVFVDQTEPEASTMAATQGEQSQPALIQRAPVSSAETTNAPIAQAQATVAAQPVAVSQPAENPQAVAQTQPVAVLQPQKQSAAQSQIKTPPVIHKKLPAQTISDDADELDDTPASLLAVKKQQRDFTPEEQSQQAYTKALPLYNKGNKQQAKSLLAEAINYSAQNVDAHRLLAVIYLEDGRADLATEVVETALAAHPKDQSLLRLYLQALVQTEKYNEAVLVMEKRLQLTTPEDLGYLAGLYQKINDHLNAVKLYAQALQLMPSKSVWWMGQGISFEVLEKYKEAMKSYQQSLSTGQLPGNLADYAINRMNLIKQHKADSLS